MNPFSCPLKCITTNGLIKSHILCSENVYDSSNLSANASLISESANYEHLTERMNDLVISN